MNLEIKKIEAGARAGVCEGFESLSASTTDTHQYQDFLLIPLSLGLFQTSKWITLASWRHSSHLHRIFSLLIMTTQIVS